MKAPSGVSKRFILNNIRIKSIHAHLFKLISKFMFTLRVSTNETLKSFPLEMNWDYFRSFRYHKSECIRSILVKWTSP